MTATRSISDLFADARQGNLEALSQLEQMSADPNTDADFLRKFAFFWEEKSANDGNPDAAYELGRKYQYGIGMTIDLAWASYWFYYSAKEHAKKSPASMLAISNLKTLADDKNADPKVIWNYSCCLREGFAVAQDYKEALKYCRLAAEKNYMYAMHGIAWYHRYGKGVAVDLNLAADWYFKAATLGYKDAFEALNQLYTQNANPKALFYLAQCYENGYTVSADKQKALELYQKAANKKDANAYYRLGRLYEYGIGVKQDLIKASAEYVEAAKLYKKGQEGCKHAFEDLCKLAEKPDADPSVMSNLALCYYNGYFTPQNIEKAAIFGLCAYRNCQSEKNRQSLLNNLHLTLLSLPKTSIRTLILMELFDKLPREIVTDFNHNPLNVVSAVLVDQNVKKRIKNWDLLVRKNEGGSLLKHVKAMPDTERKEQLYQAACAIYSSKEITGSEHDREKYILFAWCLEKNAIEQAVQIFKLLSPSFSDYKITFLQVLSEEDQAKVSYRLFKELVARRKYNEALLFLNNVSDCKLYDQDVLTCFSHLNIEHHPELLALEAEMFDRVLRDSANIDPHFLAAVKSEDKHLNNFATKINAEFYGLVELFDTCWEIRNLKRKENPLAYFFANTKEERNFIKALREIVKSHLEGEKIYHSKSDYNQLTRAVCNLIESAEGVIKDKDMLKEIAEAKNHLAKISGLLDLLAAQEAEINAQKVSAEQKENQELLVQKPQLIEAPEAIAVPEALYAPVEILARDALHEPESQVEDTTLTRHVAITNAESARNVAITNAVTKRDVALANSLYTRNITLANAGYAKDALAVAKIEDAYRAAVARARDAYDADVRRAVDSYNIALTKTPNASSVAFANPAPVPVVAYVPPQIPVSQPLVSLSPIPDISEIPYLTLYAREQNVQEQVTSPFSAPIDIVDFSRQLEEAPPPYVPQAELIDLSEDVPLKSEIEESQIEITEEIKPAKEKQKQEAQEKQKKPEQQAEQKPEAIAIPAPTEPVVVVENIPEEKRLRVPVVMQKIANNPATLFVQKQKEEREKQRQKQKHDHETKPINQKKRIAIAL